MICETVQYITIDAWPAIYGKDNEHDLDSRDVLEEFRHWGEEFEKWWMSLPEVELDPSKEEIEKTCFGLVWLDKRDARYPARRLLHPVPSMAQ